MAVDKDAVMRLLTEKTYRPLTRSELESRLSVPEADRAAFSTHLDELIHAGQIVALRGDRIGLPNKMNLLTGVLQAHPNGFAFLVPDKPGERAADVFIGRNDTGDAMHGDKVVVRIERMGRSGRPEGRVIRVLERRVRRVVGEFQQGTGFGYVVPEEGRHLHHIYIPRGRDKRALAGQIVVAEIRKYPEGNRDPEGEVMRVIGSRKDPGVDREVVVERHGLSSRFPTEVLTEAKRVPTEIDTVELGLRVDLRGLKVFTIDGEKAKDFDDAVAIQRLTDGRFRLWVSIADVAHYVKPGTDLDKEARARATSVYFADSVIPMLPEEISNNICSLVPHQPRLTMTAELEYDSEGKLVRSQFYDSVIVSKERLTYTQVKQILTDRNEDLLGRYRYLEDDLRAMQELALKLKSRRDERGSLDFDLPEPDLLLDLEGNIESIVRAERNIAHRIIEEFMLAANEAVADFLQKENVPGLYRCHDEPDPAKIEDLRQFLHNLNVRVDQRITPKALQRILRQVQGKPLEKLVNEVVLRTMKHAYYSPRNTGHFGLASETYLHFTSPIRRYPDLVTHRSLKAVLERGGMSERQREELRATLGETALHCSEREKNAERAEREVLAAKKVEFMRRFAGEEFDGYISGVTSFGFFVELRDLFVDGLVHVSNLGDDYYEFRDREHSLVGTATGRRFQLADRVRVRVARVDVEKRHIDFELVSEVFREALVQEEAVAQRGRPVPQVAAEPAHPETGDGRGRGRRQAPVPRSGIVRTARPEESPDEDRRRRARGRKERAVEPRRGQEEARAEGREAREPRAKPERRERAAVRPAAPELEAPPVNEESPTVPPPMAEHPESFLTPPAAEEGGADEAAGRRRRRRRGGRGRRRRGAEDGVSADGQGAEGEFEGEESEEEGENAARPAPLEGAEGEPALAAAEAPTAEPALEGEAPVRGRREPRPRRGRGRRPEGDTEGEAQSETPAREAATPAPSEATASAVSEGSAQTAAESDGTVSAEAGEPTGEEHESELAFVAKRRRRRRGGRSRRRPGAAGGSEAGGGEADEGDSEAGHGEAEE